MFCTSPNSNHALQARCKTLSLPYKIQYSYGIVRYEPLTHASIEDMLHEADSAMYELKRGKR